MKWSSKSDLRRRKKFHRGRWAVDRERFQLDDRIPPENEARFITMGQAMGAVLGQVGLEKQKKTSDLLAQWEQIAGEVVGRHTRPLSLQDGILTVSVDSSVWLSEISRFGKGLLLEKVQKVLGSTMVKSLRLQVGGNSPEDGRPK